MVTIEFTVNGTLLALVTDLEELSSSTETVNYFQCHFDFNSDYDELNKLVTFKNASYNEIMDVVPNDDGYCYIPWEILQHKGVILVEISGFTTSNGYVVQRLLTNTLQLFWNMQEGMLDSSKATLPTGTAYEQFVDQVEEASELVVEKVNEAAEYVSEASTYSENAAASALSASTYAGNASNSASAASSSAEDAATYAEDSEDSAEAAAASAEYAEYCASQSGYFDMEINSEGHLIYYSVNAGDIDFDLVDGHLILTA